MGLTGYVKNKSDGSVKIVAEGEEKKLQELIDFCYNVPSARVEKIDAKWGEAIGEFGGFCIRY